MTANPEPTSTPMIVDDVSPEILAAGVDRSAGVASRKRPYIIDSLDPWNDADHDGLPDEFDDDADRDEEQDLDPEEMRRTPPSEIDLFEDDAVDTVSVGMCDEEVCNTRAVDASETKLSHHDAVDHHQQPVVQHVVVGAAKRRKVEPRASPSAAVQEERMRQTLRLLEVMPESAFDDQGDLEKDDSVPLLVRYLHVSGIENAQARVRKCMEQVRDPEKRDLLLTRLPQWWNDDTCQSERLKEMWFFGIRKLVKAHLDPADYQKLGLDDAEKRLKTIQRREKQAAEEAATSKRQREAYDAHVRQLGDVGQDERNYKQAYNADAIASVLMCLDEATTIRHARELRHIAMRLECFDRILNADVLAAPELESPDAELLQSKAQCVLRLKELLQGHLTDAEYRNWWKSGVHFFCIDEVRYFVAQGIPGLVHMFGMQMRQEQLLKVVDDQGACYVWDATKLLWVSGGVAQLENAFLDFAREVLRAEEMRLHAEYINSCCMAARSDGEEQVTKDEMLAAMLNSVQGLNRKIVEGTLSSVYRKMLIPELKDVDFEFKMNTDAPDMFPCRDGFIIDLRTRALRRRVPTDHFTFESPVAYVHKAQYQRVIKFFLAFCGGKIEEYLNGGGSSRLDGQQDAAADDSSSVARQKRAEAMLRSLQVHLGYCLTGRCLEKKFMQHFGMGDTGKSSLWGMMKWIMNEFLVTAPSALIEQVQRKRGVHEHTAGFMPLLRARVVTVEELDENITLSEGQVKNFTSGGIDSVPVRGCGEAKTRSVQIFFKLILVTNHKVRFGKNVHPASINRALIYAYQTQFDRQSEESKEAAKLMKSTEFLDEVFSWLVEGSMEWYRLGSTPPCKISTEELQQYKCEESPMDAFLDACTEKPTAGISDETRKNFYVTKTQLREKCKAWYQDKVNEGVYEPRDFPKLQELKTLMEARNYKERQIMDAGKERGFVGLRLIEASNQTADEQAPRAADADLQ